MIDMDSDALPSLKDRLARAQTLVLRGQERPGTVTTADEDLFSTTEHRLPEVHASSLTANVVASGLQHHGGLVVRELLTHDEVAELRKFLVDGTLRIEETIEASEAVDRMLATMTGAYRARGFLEVVEEYLGEPPVGTAHRTVVKRNQPSTGLPWHQDASFFRGACRALDAWVALTDCGATCPSLSLVPRRIEQIIDPAQTTVAPSQVMNDAVDGLLDGHSAPQPELRPGDAILLDEMTVHRTGSASWEAPFRDVAITWFFAPSRLPTGQHRPIAL